MTAKKEPQVNEQNMEKTSVSASPEVTTPVAEATPEKPKTIEVDPVKLAAIMEELALKERLIAEKDSEISRLQYETGIQKEQLGKLQPNIDFSRPTVPAKPYEMTDAEIRLAVDSEPKEQVYIPLQGMYDNAKTGTTHPVTINGVKWDVPVGQFIEVPRPIAELVKARFRVNNQLMKLPGNVYDLGTLDHNTVKEIFS